MKAHDGHAAFSRPALGALVLVMLGGLVLGVRLFREHGQLNAELAALRAAQSPGAVKSDTPPSAENASVSAEIERESALLSAAEAKAVEIGKSLPPMSDEEWRSLGRVEELGQQAADFLRTFSEAIERTKQSKPMTKADESAFMQQMLAWVKRLEAIGEMEDDPAEIARLHTATLGMRMTLDAATQDRVQQQIERDFTQLREQKLTRPQRPDAGRDDWYLRRRDALNEATQRIEALIPAGQRVEFAVGQSLHLGTGLRSKSEVRADGHGSLSMAFDLPGIDLKQP